MLLAHLGVGVFIVGVTLVKGYEIERDVRLDVGQRVAVGGVRLRFPRRHAGAGTELPRAASARSRCATTGS